MPGPRKAIIAFGFVTCAFWLSKAVFPWRIPPLAPMPDFSVVVGRLAEASPWIREQFPALDKPDDVVLEDMRREFRVGLIRAWALIAAGALAGVLIVSRRAAGRWLALCLAVFVLAVTAAGYLREAPGRGWTYFEQLASIARRFPLITLRSVLDMAFLAFTIWFLARRKIGGAFRRDGSPADMTVS